MRHFESMPDIAESVDYKLLKNIATKKLNSRSNPTTMLTKFRQNNELCVLNLKKIIKQILDSKKADLLPLQVLAIDL